MFSGLKRGGGEKRKVSCSGGSGRGGNFIYSLGSGEGKARLGVPGLHGGGGRRLEGGAGDVFSQH